VIRCTRDRAGNSVFDAPSQEMHEVVSRIAHLNPDAEGFERNWTALRCLETTHPAGRPIP
jgi:hypothetical protein